MRRAILAILACIFFISPVAGCRTGAHEIDDLAYVFMIGIDRGVSDKLRFTFQMPSFSGESNDQSGSQTGASKSNQLETVTIDAPTFYSAEIEFSTFLSRALNFAHTKYLVISEDLAREGVEPFMDGMVRSYQLRRSLYILVSKGSAADFVRNFKPVFGSSVSKTQELMMMNGDMTELFEIMTYNEFLSDMKRTTTQATATLVAVNDFSNFKETGEPEHGFKTNGQYTAGELPRNGGNKFEFCGTAIFDGPKMIGELTADETRAMELLAGTFHSSQFVIPDPENQALRVGVIILQRKKPDIRITYKDRNPVISVKVYLDGAIQNIQSTTEYEHAKKSELEHTVEKFVKDMIGRTVDKCKGLGCDVFNFGEVAVKKFLTIQAWDDYKWISHFKDAEVTTEVEYVIRRTGTMTKTEGTKTA